MEISIIIVNYNTRKLTLASIKSIREARLKVSYEIIVVDNASGEKFEIAGKDITFIKNKVNLGFAKANNQGIARARGKYIFLLNSDTIVKTGAIDLLYNFALDHEDAGVVVPKLLNSDGSVQASVFRLPTIGRAIQQYFFGQSDLLAKCVPDEEEASSVECAVMAAFLITPRGLEKVGKLNEKYFMYFEDLDYCRKVQEKGLKIYYVPQAEVVHIHGASGGKSEYLVEASKKYHGIGVYYLYTLILWLGQKWEKVIK